MSRSTQGCWTCRLRHKKCDETRPQCSTCTSRNVACHGYGDKPAWMDGGHLEERQRRQIKSAVKQNFRLGKRRLWSSGSMAMAAAAGSSIHDGQLTGLGSADIGGTVQGVLPAFNLHGEISTPGGRTGIVDATRVGRQTSHDHEVDTGPLLEETTATSPPARTADNPGSPFPSLFPVTSPSPQPARRAEVLEYQDAELLMHYFDQVFPLQFRFYQRRQQRSAPGNNRGWLLWLLVKTGPLYQAALSLSALHQFTLRYHDQDEKLVELNEYHSKAISDLRSFLRENGEGAGQVDERSRRVEVLACGVSLISFELFRGGVSDWEVHLNALASIVHDLEPELHSKDNTETSGPLVQGAALNSIESAALPFLIAVVLWFDLLSCASTGLAPRLPYRELIEKRGVNLEDVLGCKSWVMLAIGDLASLNAWKRNARQDGSLSTRELLERSSIIERNLEQGLAMLATHDALETSERIAHKSSSSHNSDSPEVVVTITRVFASAALVQLHTITSGAFSNVPETRLAVKRTMSALKHVADYQDLRGLIWPLCLSGCMAQPHQQPFFRDLLLRVIGDAGQEFGNCTTVLRILEACWEGRLHDPTQEWNWEKAMTDLRICGLLV